MVRKNIDLISRTEKWMRNYSILLNILIVLLGVLFILIGTIFFSTKPSQQNSDTGNNSSSISETDYNNMNTGDSITETIFISIGCSLISSGLIAFVIYPRLESKEQLAFRHIHDEIGLHSVNINGNLLSADEMWEWPKKHLDLITDHIDDLNIILNKDSPLPPALQIRILTKQPSLLNDKSTVIKLENWAKRHPKQVVLKYRSGEQIPCYCRQDHSITFGHQTNAEENGTRIFYTYYADDEPGKRGRSFFKSIWTKPPEKLRVANSSFGRSQSSQKECIEGILQYFCEISKKNLSLSKDIEAVIVVWTDKKNKRRTFYSCNKPSGASLHNVREYNFGVVGMLQELLKNPDDVAMRTDCILLYDHENNPIKCQYIIDPRTNTIEIRDVKEQKWNNKGTKAMLAISLFRQKEDRPEVFGAMTFDFAETLKEKNEEQMKELFHSVRQCRDILIPMLSSNIKTDYETELLKLEKEEQ